MSVRALVAVAALAVLQSGCILSRLVDRSFIGASIKRPTFPDRQTTGMLLLPFTFAIDLATLPLQAILVAIAGDNFPFNDRADAMPSPLALLEQQPAFNALDEPTRQVAARELEQLLASGRVTAQTLLALGSDGHWTLVSLAPEARLQLLARAGALLPVAGTLASR